MLMVCEERQIGGGELESCFYLESPTTYEIIGNKNVCQEFEMKCCFE